MTSGEWLFAAAGGAVALAGLGLLGWALLGDRVRTRRPRRRGELRRCPRCWYDMTATEGLLCPECGRDARRERRLGRSHRRWRWAAVGLAVVAVGAGTIAFPHGRGGVWRRWLPDTALLLVIRVAPSPDWAVEELARRDWGDPMLPVVEHPNRFTGWQIDLLEAGCLRLLREKQSPGKGQTPARMLLDAYAQRPARALPILYDDLASDDPVAKGSATSIFKHWSNEFSVAEIEAALEYLSEREQANLLAVIERKRDATIDQRRAAIDDLDLSPPGIAEQLPRCTLAELGLLYRRLGLRRPSSFLASPTEELEITWEALYLDDDDTLDGLVTVRNPTRPVDDGLFFLRDTSGWRFIGRLARPPLSFDWTPRETLSTRGRRWIRFRYDPGAITLGSKTEWDAWYRVRANKLELVQFVGVAGDSFGYLRRSLAAGEPVIERMRGRDFAAYEMGCVVEIQVGFGGRNRMVAIGEHAGVFRFPLGGDPAAFGEPLGGGPWGGQRVEWFLDALEEEVLPPLLPRLCELAISEDEDLQHELRSLMDMLADSDEVEAVRVAMDAYIAEHGAVEGLVKLRDQLDRAEVKPPG